jgi:hypothetical protein
MAINVNKKCPKQMHDPQRCDPAGVVMVWDANFFLQRCDPAGVVMIWFQEFLPRWGWNDLVWQIWSQLGLAWFGLSIFSTKMRPRWGRNDLVSGLPSPVGLEWFGFRNFYPRWGRKDLISLNINWYFNVDFWKTHHSSLISPHSSLLTHHSSLITPH